MNSNKPSNDSSPEFFGSGRSFAGTQQSALLQEYQLHENMAQFVRENIPSRFMYAKGAGAYGTFTVTGDIANLSRAKIFSKKGNTCRVFVRFSSMSGEKGSPDTTRDTRGFSVRFYTEDGNWDLVGSNSPVYFIKDAGKFPALALSQKKDTKTNQRNHTAAWDFMSLNPESLHQLMILMSDRGIPAGYQHMNGFGTHTFSLINDAGESVWVKFHLVCQQDTESLSSSKATEIAAENPDFAQESLYNALQKGILLKWSLSIQVMTEEQAREYRWNPFDATKVWLKSEFPLIEVGEIVLNEIPDNYLEHVEKAAFSPSNLIDGIGLSPDRLLQGRMLAYKDAQRYRIGNDVNQLEVNRCAYSTADFTINPEASQELFRNWSDIAFNDADEDHYTQPGLLYTKVLNAEGRREMVQNIVNSMKQISGPKKDEIINRQLCHFFRANVELGMEIAKGLQININANTFAHANM